MLAVVFVIGSLLFVPGLSADVKAETIIHSGTCGDNVTWKLTSSSSSLILTISGTGAMNSSSPWTNYRPDITSVVIEDGVTSIGDKAFYSCKKLSSITIPSSVTSIGDFAFYSCEGMTSITIPSSVTSIGDYAFRGCDNLATIILPCNFDKSKFNSSQIILDMPNGDRYTVSGSSIIGSFVYKHNVSYLSDGATITAGCDSEACANSNPSATLTLVAPTSLTYDGQAKAATLTGLSDFNTFTGLSVAENSIKYFAATKSGNTYTKGGSALDGAPTNAGDYIAEITVKDSTASVGYTIAKANVTVTVPTAKANLTYSGSAQALVTAGSVMNGTLYYAVGTDASTAPADNLFTLAIPKLNNAKTYYVWYKVVGDTNYKDKEATYIGEVKINKALVAPNKPDATKTVEYAVASVYGVELPTNWKWADADKDKALEVGKEVTATAVYNGTDKGNYETESVEIAITRKAKPETHVEQKPTETTPTTTQTPTVVEKVKEVTVEKKGTFEVTSEETSTTNTVTYTAVANTKAKSVTIPDTVTVDGKKYEVTEVSTDALKNSSATTVTIGKNVTTLAPEAFKGSNVKTITIKSKKLTKQSVKNAFKGLKVKKLIVKVKVGSKKENKKYIKKYKKFFTKKNIGVKAVVK
jgi:hypothetical protein